MPEKGKRCVCGVKRKRNPQELTIDEIITATRLVDEGATECAKVKTRYGEWRYPQFTIEMCDKEALQPVARVFGTTIGRAKSKTIECPPHLFPPDGKGRWRVRTKRTEQIVARLKPLLTKEFLRKYEDLKRRCR